MATTTNYGWTTPDDTALVKDGASAIRTLGSSVDTTTKNLNPSTTLGDIEYRSSTANTNTRLGIGSTGQVLTVSGGVPAWATSSSGGMTLLSTTTLSGVTTTISGISGSYNNLFFVVSGATNNGGNGNFRVLPNSSATITTTTGFASSLSNDPRTDSYLFLTIPGTAIGSGNNENSYAITIANYASTTQYKPIHMFGGYNDTGNTRRAIERFGHITTTSAITSIEFSNDSGGSFLTGTVLLYGVK